jgi:hypothetical protein
MTDGDGIAQRCYVYHKSMALNIQIDGLGKFFGKFWQRKSQIGIA